MKVFSTVAFFLGLAAAAPSVLEARAGKPSKVKIHGISLLGTGCPRGSADVQVDATGTIFEATFSEYTVETGPGTKASDWRKNCKLTMNMEFDDGYQFTIMDTDMSGFAQIPRGATGTCKNVFNFSQRPLDKVETSIKLRGPYSKNFDLPSKTGIRSWSPCGGSTAILNMNTQCNIDPTDKKALIAVDNISGSLKVKFAVEWRFCH